MEEHAGAFEPFVQLIAVHGSDRIWERLNYSRVEDLSEGAKEYLTTYGDSAVFMVKIVGI